MYVYMVYVCMCMCYRSLNHDFLSDVAWTISMYLESVAMVPQLYMFQKQASDEGGVVEVSSKRRAADIILVF